MHKLLILMILFSCSSYKSHHNENYADKQISKYLKQWRDNNKIDKKFQNQYARYLDSVENIFLREGLASQIDFYFSTLQEINDNTEMERENFEKQFPNESYQAQKTKVVTQYYDSLIEDRSQKLADYYGFNMYSKLMKNRNKFLINEKEIFNFPL